MSAFTNFASNTIARENEAQRVLDASEHAVRSRYVYNTLKLLLSVGAAFALDSAIAVLALNAWLAVLVWVLGFALLLAVDAYTPVSVYTAKASVSIASAGAGACRWISSKLSKAAA